VRALDVRMIEQAHHVARELGAVAARIVRLVALAVAAEIERQHAMVARECGQNPRGDELALEVAGEAMEQHHGRSRALFAIMEAHAGRVEGAVAGARVDCGGGRA
jgi:hypothetical protein